MFNTIIAALLGAVLSALAGAAVGAHFYSRYADAVLAQTKTQCLADVAVREAQYSRDTVTQIDAALRGAAQEQEKLIERLAAIDRRTDARERAWRKEREVSQTCDVWMRQPVGCSLRDSTGGTTGATNGVSGAAVLMPYADSVGP